MQAAQISDGFTLDFKVSGRGPFKGIKGKYRPALFEAVCEYQDAGRGKKRAEATVKFIIGSETAPHLLSWDMLDENGEPIPINATTVKRIPGPQLERLTEIIGTYALTEQEDDEKN